MELSWSTFVLEIINFLVLVWIIKRFLFAPVMGVIKRRREEIEKTLADAETKKEEADNLKQQFEGRLNDWNQEKQKLREELAREMESERASKMEELQKALEEARQKSLKAEQRRREDAMHEAEERALAQAGKFAAILLKQGAGLDTEQRLIDMFIHEVQQLRDATVKQLRASVTGQNKPLLITSAFNLDQEYKQQLQSVLRERLGMETDIQFTTDAELIAGLRVTVGAYVIGANLKDELAGFISIHHE